jgi:hypothetical protein
VGATPFTKSDAIARAVRVADTWACPTKRGKPATCSLQPAETLDLKEAKALLEELGGIKSRPIGLRHERIPQDQSHSVNVALRDHAAIICIFLCVTRCARASLGGMPCGEIIWSSGKAVDRRASRPASAVVCDPRTLGVAGNV